jgi:hypothetical protein
VISTVAGAIVIVAAVAWAMRKFRAWLRLTA